MLLQDQVQPDKIKLLTPQQVAALGPRRSPRWPTSASSGVRFSDRERARALADLEPLALGRLLSQKRVEFDKRLLGQHEPVRDARGGRDAGSPTCARRREGARRRRCRPRASSRSRSAYFRTEAAAIAYAEELAQLGVKLAKVEPRAQPITQTLVVVRDPQQPVVARLKDLAGAVPGQRDQDHRVRAHELTPLPIRHAASAADVAQARALFEEYAAWLGVDLCFQGFARGTRHAARRLRAAARPPAARGSAGRGRRCVALRPLPGADAAGDRVGEVKRLYVRPQARGTGARRAPRARRCSTTRAPSVTAN